MLENEAIYAHVECTQTRSTIHHDAPDRSRKYVVSETSSQNLSRLARTKFSPERLDNQLTKPIRRW